MDEAHSLGILKDSVVFEHRLAEQRPEDRSQRSGRTDTEAQRFWPLRDRQAGPSARPHLSRASPLSERLPEPARISPGHHSCHTVGSTPERDCKSTSPKEQVFARDCSRGLRGGGSRLCLVLGSLLRTRRPGGKDAIGLRALPPGKEGSFGSTEARGPAGPCARALFSRRCGKPHDAGLPLGGANHALAIEWEVSEGGGSEDFRRAFPRLLPPVHLLRSAGVWRSGLPVDQSDPAPRVYCPPRGLLELGPLQSGLQRAWLGAGARPSAGRRWVLRREIPNTNTRNPKRGTYGNAVF
ncbi:uncharacterized protein LOC106009619 [Heterocephalus glaber]|uniref:Uncharacterized protein LOC106009619 n=1 Tax=Heterocephalus glaber TaxID=10181 RepID=A0AAX6T3G1_HETGA|nr:uncharacterized protein LOC106009619 [Heterocephalus glaber]